MQVTPETINGKLCTVIRKPFNAEWVKEQLDMGVSPPIEVKLVDGQTSFDFPSAISDESDKIISYKQGCFEIEAAIHLVTILPALRRNPTPKEVFAYEAQGLRVFRTGKNGATHRACLESHIKEPVTHATHNGQSVEIAIEEKG